MQILSVCAAMIGVILLTNPNIVTGGSRNDLIDLDKYPYFYIGVVVALVGSINSGFAYLMMRRMGTSVHSTHGPLYFGIFNCISCFLMAMASGETLGEPMSLSALCWVVLFGSFGFLA